MFFFVLFSLFSLVLALPVAPVIRDVWTPPITTPSANTTWSAGGTYTVTWNTSTKPQEVTNPNGMVYLRTNGLTQSTPLANGFPLTDGQVNITIPADTQPSDEWILVLFGDSGNFSPNFTITSPAS